MLIPVSSLRFCLSNLNVDLKKKKKDASADATDLPFLHSAEMSGGFHADLHIVSVFLMVSVVVMC